MAASLLMLLTGGTAWTALWRARRLGRLAPSACLVPLVLAGITLASMARTGTLGGEIRHPEIVPQGAAGDAGAWIQASGVAAWVNDSAWLWPAFEALHFIGLWVLFGVLLLVNLRLLGLMAESSYAALHRLLPWAALALGANVITGMLFVLALPDSYLTNFSFHWKIGLLVLAGAHLLYLTEFDEPWAVQAGRHAGGWARPMAAVSLVLWVGVMYFGRMLPFLGDAY